MYHPFFETGSRNDPLLRIANQELMKTSERKATCRKSLRYCRQSSGKIFLKLANLRSISLAPRRAMKRDEEIVKLQNLFVQTVDSLHGDSERGGGDANFERAASNFSEYLSTLASPIPSMPSKWDWDEHRRWTICASCSLLNSAKTGTPSC